MAVQGAGFRARLELGQGLREPPGRVTRPEARSLEGPRDALAGGSGAGAVPHTRNKKASRLVPAQVHA